MPYDKKMLTEGFESVLIRNNQTWCPGVSWTQPEVDKIVQDLLAVVASTKGIDLTVDVGVDNRIRGPKIPFGTPWSMDHLRAYMKPKKSRWEARNEVFKSFGKNNA